MVNSSFRVSILVTVSRFLASVVSLCLLDVELGFSRPGLLIFLLL